MRDLPILFSAPMVRALLAGTKTQTRRLIKVEAERPIIDFVKVATDKDTGRAIYEMKDKAGQHVAIAAGKNFITQHYSPPIAVGDRLYVREHWRVSRDFDRYAPRDLKPGIRPLWYDAGYMMDTGHQKFFSTKQGADFDESQHKGRHRQGMHMPRWASRITLLVDEVKVERLQGISEEDAAAEGWPPPEQRAKTGLAEIRDAYPIGWYAWLWDSINGEGAWDQNPWVVAYTFRTIIENIDYIGGQP